MLPGIQVKESSVSKEINTLKEFCEVIKTNKVSYLYCLFSGGRDSLVALHISKRVSEHLRVPLEAIHVDTTISTPGNLQYVEAICREFNVKLSIVRPKHDYFYYVDKWGFPTATRRWCCYHLKIEPLKNYFQSRNVRDGLLVDGIRKDESPKRSRFPKIGVHRHFRILCYHPIFEWGRVDVLNYIATNALKENPLYEVFPRATECWCPAFKTVKQFEMLKKNFPEFFQKLVDAESKLKSKGSALYKNRRKIYLKDL
jgi:3'-phosphoadenosine 5'-phosphosulfate sulfotransferase (PAPS reductase)/FAD synthetase